VTLVEVALLSVPQVGEQLVALAVKVHVTPWLPTSFWTVAFNVTAVAPSRIVEILLVMVTVIATEALTVMLSCLLAVCGVGVLESVAVRVKSQVPAVVGVPVIAPVDELSDKPGGSVPTGTLQVMGGVPPETCRVAL
jgi:hypothetical protein